MYHRGISNQKTVEKKPKALYSTYEKDLEEFLNLYLGPEHTRHGFIHPHETTISTLAADIIEGSVHTCVISTMYSTNELYLVLKKDFPSNVNDLIGTAGRVFDKKIPSMCRAQLFVHRDDLTPGAVVCIKDDKKEWQRGKIVETEEVLEERIYRTHYRVVTLDLGEYYLVDRIGVFYLPKELATQPALAIKTTLQLDSFYNGPRNNMFWDKKICRKLLALAFDKPIKVKFIRKMDTNNEIMWQVSLLRFEDGSPACFPNDSRPIEQQIIAKRHGEYIMTSTTPAGKSVRGRGRGRGLIQAPDKGYAVAGQGHGRGARTLLAKVLNSSDDSEDEYCNNAVYLCAPPRYYAY